VKKFLLKVFGFILGTMVISFLFELYIGHKLDKGYRYYFQADWHDLKNHNSDMLFVGNSRTLEHFDPFFIEHKFGVKAEVLSQEGQHVNFLWLKFKQYLKSNPPPKEVYLQSDYFFFEYSKDLFGINNYATCFFNDRVDLTSLSDVEGYKTIYRIMPLAAVQFPLFTKVILEDTVKETFEKHRGYMPKNETFRGDWAHPNTVKVNPGDKGYTFIDSFMVACKKQDIRLYFIFSPVSFPSWSVIESKELVKKEIDKKSGVLQFPVSYRDYNRADLYSDIRLFYNHSHLNTEGVSVFMNQFAGDSLVFLSFRK